MAASPTLDRSSAPPIARDRQALRNVVRLPRPSRGTALWVAIGAGVAYVLAPQLEGLLRSLRSLALVEPAWVAIGGILVVLRYAAAAASLQAATPSRIPFLPTLLVQLASSFVGRLTPEGVGWLVLNQRYLERVGLSRESALGTITLKIVAGAVSRGLIALVVVALVGARGDLGIRLPVPPSAVALGAFGAVLVGLVVAIAAGPLAARARSALARAIREAASILREPGRALALFATTAALTVLSGLALAASVAALGVSVPVAHVFAVYLGGTAVAALSPTPGNIGAVELALSAGLTTIGVPAAAAVAAVLVYRLLTFWLPVLPGFVALRRLQGRGLI